jgi:hypothetical protein
LPGSGKTFEDFFELTLPTAEYISPRRPDPRRQGELILSTWTSTSSSAPFIPSGTLIEQDTVFAASLGGQTAVRCQSDLKSKSAANSLEENNPRLVVLCGHARFVPRPQRGNRPAIEALVRCLRTPAMLRRWRGEDSVAMVQTRRSGKPIDPADLGPADIDA